MPRAAIYARYSSDLQSDRSIDDQVALCRAYAAREGLHVVAVYTDRAMSGASLHARAGMQDLLARAKVRAFDVVLAETLSRIGRDEEDRAGIRKRLTFADIKIMTPADGVVTRLTDGIKAVIDSQYLEDNKTQIRRGLAGVVRSGRHAGGRAYGYRPVRRLGADGEPIRGELEIVEAEAEIVRRIFAAYAGGQTPRAIAAALNLNGLPAPRGRCWRASTIVGNAARGHSMLANELYAGVIVWNRIHMVKDPDTGRRVSRINPQGDWHRAAAEQLRIVPQCLWEDVQARRTERAGLPHVMRATPRRVLSGLLRCGACGAGMSISGSDRKGIRIVCSAHKEGGCAACDNGRYYYLAEIEERVLGALRGQLGSPERLALYVKTYNEERARLAGAKSADRDRLARRAGEAKRALDRALEHLVHGRITTAEADAMLPALRAAHAAAAAELAAAAEPPKVVSLHPGLVERYLADLRTLAETIARDQADGHHQAAAAVRRIVESVTVAPAPAGTIPQLTVEGHLASLIDAPAFPRGKISAAKSVAEPVGSGGVLWSASAAVPFRIAA